MSRENVEIASRWYDVAKSKEALLAAMPRTMGFCHPEVEWSAPEDGTTYRGRDGVRQRLEQWLESFDDYRFEVDRVIDCGGDDVLVVGTEIATGAMSGAEVRSVDYELLTIRDGMIVRIREYYDEATALAAAGLSESRGQA
jgi:ketosteroid isomerase-like protein